jgi:SulP family sulfate permease|tara:strand:- start:4149 stop:6386 length:2238 start_codon:yes stop_codon:yes gene_type:complete
MKAGSQPMKKISSHWFKSIGASVNGFVTTLPGTIAFGTILYAPLGEEWLGRGITACLLGHLISGLVTVCAANNKEVIIGPRSFVAVLFSAVITLILGAFETQYGLEVASAIALSACAVIGIFSAILQLIFGYMKIGKIVEFIPSQVVSSLMNVTAFLIFMAQLPRMIGFQKDLFDLGFFQILSQLSWFAISLSVITILLMLMLPRKTYGIPSSILALVVGILIHSTLHAQLPTQYVATLPSLNPLEDLKLPDFSVEYLAILIEAPQVLLAILFTSFSLAILNTLSLLISGKQVEKVTKINSNNDRDLRANGIGNLLVSLVGSVPGTGKAGASLIAANNGGRGITVPLTVSIFYGATILFLAPFLNLLPIPVLASVSAVLSFRLLDAKGKNILLSFFLGRFSKIKQEISYFSVLVSVLLVTLFFNLIAAILVGIVATIIDFLIKTSKFQVKLILGVSARSRTARSSIEEQYLDNWMHQVVIIDIQGFLLFSVAEALQKNIRSELNNDIGFVIFNMNKVHYLDETGCESLIGIINDLRQNGVVVVITEINENNMLKTVEWQQIVATFAETERFADLDAALESVEERLLKNVKKDINRDNFVTSSYLFRDLNKGDIDIAMEYLGKKSFKEGQFLHETDNYENDPGLFILSSGTVDVYLIKDDGENNSPSLRLFTYTAGAILGEVSFVDAGARSANVLARTDVECRQLLRSTFQRLKVEHPVIAFQIMQNISKLLSKRLRQTNILVSKS